jgi:Uncharacterized protein conserved in bacteria
MKNKEIENDDYGNDVFASEDVFKRRFRRLEEDELVAHKTRIAIATNKKKRRVTIYIDSDIIDSFKERARREHIGYQTLMNEALREVVTEPSTEGVKEELLRDEKFLKRLKTALSV